MDQSIAEIGKIIISYRQAPVQDRKALQDKVNDLITKNNKEIEEAIKLCDNIVIPETPKISLEKLDEISKIIPNVPFETLIDIIKSLNYEEFGFEPKIEYL